MTSLSDAIKNCDTLEKFSLLMRPQYEIEGDIKKGTAKRVAKEGSHGMSVKLGCCAGKSYAHTDYTGSVSQSFIVQKFNNLVEAGLKNWEECLVGREGLIKIIEDINVSLDNEVEILLSQNLFKRICHAIISLFKMIFCAATTLTKAMHGPLSRNMKAMFDSDRSKMLKEKAESDALNKKMLDMNKEMGILCEKIETIKTTKATLEKTPGNEGKLAELELELQATISQANATIAKMEKNSVRLKELMELAGARVEKLVQVRKQFYESRQLPAVVATT